MDFRMIAQDLTLAEVWAFKVDPMTPTFTAPGTKRLKLRFDEPLLGRCSLTQCHPR